MEPEASPLDWAKAQKTLVRRSRRSGEGERDSAARGSDRGLSRRVRGRNAREDPLLWAATQNNLVTCWNAWRARERDARLEEAVAAYRAALEEWTRKLVPLDWARAQNNLGYALAKLANRIVGRTAGGGCWRPARVALDEGRRASSARLGDDSVGFMTACEARRTGEFGRSARGGGRGRMARRWTNSRASELRSTGPRASAARGSP